MKRSTMLKGLPILLVAGLLIGWLAWPGQAKSGAEATLPKLLAVKFHADWCGTCKAMEPELKKVRQQMASEPVLFLTLDLTDDQTKSQANYLAAMLGVDEAWSEYHEKTGVLVLVDPSTRRITKVLTKPFKAEPMRSEISAAIPMGG